MREPAVLCTAFVCVFASSRTAVRGRAVYCVQFCVRTSDSSPVCACVYFCRGGRGQVTKAVLDFCRGGRGQVTKAVLFGFVAADLVK